MTIEQRFEKFHDKNPHVYTLLKRFVLEVVERGFEHYAIGAVWERARWEANLQVEHAGLYKFNDHFRSRYARRLNVDPDVPKGFFETRALRTA